MKSTGITRIRTGVTGRKAKHPRRERPLCFKVGYEMQADAQAFARKTERLWGRRRVYLCRDCGLWHLTSH